MGKTSLTNMISAFLANRLSFVISRTNCDVSDSYSSLWTKALKDIEASKRQPQTGFPSRQLAPPAAFPLAAAAAHAIPTQSSVPAGETLTPDTVRRALQELSTMAKLIVIFDEFDRIKSTEAITAMADTIKALSDNSVNATILIIGVADSVDELICEHQSIERPLVQFPMPRMSNDEIGSIIDKGLARLTMGIDSAAREDLVIFSQGVPYIAHLLCIFSCRAALATGRRTVYVSHVEQGMNRSLDQWQQSIKALYNEAVQSPRPGHIYKEVLLACALAEVDDMRFFSNSVVRKPLRQIANRDFEPFNYARHLRELSESARGRVLHRVGESFRLRYRISNPTLRPYIIMRGVKDKLITRDQLLERQGPDESVRESLGSEREYQPNY